MSQLSCSCEFLLLRASPIITRSDGATPSDCRVIIDAPSQDPGFFPQVDVCAEVDRSGKLPVINRRCTYRIVIDSGLVGSTDFHSSHPQGGVPREQKMRKGHLPRAICHQVYWDTKIKCIRYPVPKTNNPIPDVNVEMTHFNRGHGQPRRACLDSL